MSKQARAHSAARGTSSAAGIAASSTARRNLGAGSSSAAAIGRSIVGPRASCNSASTTCGRPSSAARGAVIQAACGSRPGSKGSQERPGSAARGSARANACSSGSRAQADSTITVAGKIGSGAHSSAVSRAGGAGGGACADSASTACTAKPVPAARAKPAGSSVDEELRAALLKVFVWCDSDSDGFLSPSELAGAHRLIAELCPADFEDGEAAAVFERANNTTNSKPVNEVKFLELTQVLVDALRLSRMDLLRGLEVQTSKQHSSFDRTVDDLKHALVRNVSNLPDEAIAEAPPVGLWRTATGGHAFALPPGADAAQGPPVTQVAFKVMQYLGMRTEDSSIIAAELASQMMGHRQMFKQMMDMCGDIRGVSADKQDTSSGPRNVDIFLAKSFPAEQVFRVRIVGLRLSTSPGPPRLAGLSGFEPAPIDVGDIPAVLLAEMKGQDVAMSGTDLSALGMSPPPPPRQLARQVSLLPDSDLQTMDLVLAASRVGRHRFRLRFKLLGGMPPARQYTLLAPRVQTAASGHACYEDHAVRVRFCSSDAQPEVASFGAFVVASVPGRMLADLVVEHEFTNCRVRVQPRDGALQEEVVPVPDLLPEERAGNLADDPEQAEKLRSLLNAQGLARRSGERDIAFASRLGRALGSGAFKYDVAATEARLQDLPQAIWEMRRGDCSGFNAGFAFALRAFGIPARVSLGFKYGKAVQQACGSIIAPHAQAEFYAQDIGWVPCDATLGLKRFGHDANSMLSFLEWRPAGLSLAEAEELAKVFPPKPNITQEKSRLQASLEAKVGCHAVSASDMEASLAGEQGIGRDAAKARVRQIMDLCGFEDISAEQLACGWAAIQLGMFKELGVGDALTAASKAGVKLYEGGPYKGCPLDMGKMKENMMIPDQIDQVMGVVGAQQEATDWAAMWPYGVFAVRYEFDEPPLR